MSDMAHILGGFGNSKLKTAGPPKPPPPLPKGHHPSRAMKMTGMPKEVMEVIAGGNQDPISAALPPVVPTFPVTAIATSTTATTGAGGSDTALATTKGRTTVKVGNKWIDASKPARKWIWANFASSARTDGLLLNHWVRHGVDYPDYPYAKFDVHLDGISYTDEEYRDKLQHDTWTRSETDHLLELVRKLELRWPVIYDRWFESYNYSTADTSNASNTTTDTTENYNNEEDEEKTSKDDDENNNNNTLAHAAVSRNMEDLQHRYYTVAAILTQHRIAQEAAQEAKALASTVPVNTANLDPTSATAKAAEALLGDTAAARVLAAADPRHQPLIHNLGTGSSNKVFDLNYEKERRAHLELLWHRTKEDEEEEMNLRKELRLVETQLRKLKKTGGHILAAADAKGGTAGAGPGGAASSRDVSRSASPAATAAGNVLSSHSPEALLDQCFASTAPVPTPGTPYLQSGRLAPPATGGSTGLNKTLLGRMDGVLEELKIPERPIPTKRVCDLYDAVRKDILTLLTLQKMALQKEGQLQSKRMKLSKMGGSIQVADEETALGIPRPQPPPAPVPTTPAAGASSVSPTKSKKSTGGKGKGASGGTGGSKKSGGGKSTKASAAGAAGGTGTSKGKTDGKSKGGTKSGEGKTKASANTAATPGGKQAPAAGGKQAPGGKQMPGGKQAPGGKAKKPAAKRKRKAEAKSPAAASAAAAAGTSAAAGVPPMKPPANTASVPGVGAPVATAPSTSATKPAGAGEGKASGKKRARKS